MKIIKVCILILICSLALISCGKRAPFIGENGNWWVKKEDTGVKAQGPKGDKGDMGESVEVLSIEKIHSDGQSDVYEISFSDGSRHSFTVQNGKDGKSISVLEIKLKESSGNIDTYEILFSDGSCHSFKVTNGQSESASCSEPYVGDNGNWWIGSTDLGIPAELDSLPPSDGLHFEITSVKSRAGLLVNGYSGSDKEVYIPSYVGGMPVIGIADGAFSGNTDIESVTLSKNTVYIGKEAFLGCESLLSVDFRDSLLDSISEAAFMNTAIKEISIPDSVWELSDNAFSGAPIENINLDNITSFGKRCLDSYKGGWIFLSKEVDNVENLAFLSSFVYIESDYYPESFDEHITDLTNNYQTVFLGARKSGDYIYQGDAESATLLRYTGNKTRVTLSDSIDGLTVKKIGSGFASYNDSLFGNVKEYIIPEGITEIDSGTFRNSGAVVYIPESVEKMWISAYETDYPPFYAFSKDSLPALKKGSTDSSASYSEDELSELREIIRYAVGIDPLLTVADEERRCFYLKDENGYSLFAVMDYFAEEIIISSSFGEKTVHTVKGDAVSSMKLLKRAVILPGVTSIESYAFDGVKLDEVFIPKSVIFADEYAFAAVVKEFLLEADSIPEGWSKLWAGLLIRPSISFGESLDQ